jgi:hypothetical protein
MQHSFTNSAGPIHKTRTQDLYLQSCYKTNFLATDLLIQIRRVTPHSPSDQGAKRSSKSMESLTLILSNCNNMILLPYWLIIHRLHNSQTLLNGLILISSSAQLTQLTAHSNYAFTIKICSWSQAQRNFTSTNQSIKNQNCSPSHLCYPSVIFNFDLHLTQYSHRSPNKTKKKQNLKRLLPLLITNIYPPTTITSTFETVPNLIK